MTSVFVPASINLRPEDGRTEAKRQEEIGMEKNVVIDKSSVLDHTMVSSGRKPTNGDLRYYAAKMAESRVQRNLRDDF